MRAAMIAILAGLAAQPALAQNQPYETLRYKAQPPAETDRNFGLPSFGMPGSELPKQRTMAPDPVPSPAPDFFAGTTDITLPKSRVPPSRGETPDFTTSFGSTTSETPTFTTGQGYSTESPAASTD